MTIHFLRSLGRQAALALVLVGGALGGLVVAAPAATVAAKPPFAVSGDLDVHDPSMGKDGAYYYVFCTGQEAGINHGAVQIRRSKDLKDWAWVGTIFDAPPAWIAKEIGEAPNVWAPDVSYRQGQYWVYYAVSHFGSRDSVIGLATNKTLDLNRKDYKWVDRGMVMRSHESDDWNAIDPNVFRDPSGGLWMVFGSYWSGIKMRALGADGMLSPGDATQYSLASRGGKAIEAPGIVKHAGRYYLFVSFDRCCAGVNSTYRIMVGRADKVTGPYLDKSGAPLLNGGGTQLLAAKGREIGPGGQFVFQDGPQNYLVYHFYDRDQFGRNLLGIHLLGWDADGWPVVR